jgi:glycosyltransferase involved in cell wall biosynthesis/Tfp pilus assembly protein PilF
MAPAHRPDQTAPVRPVAELLHDSARFHLKSGYVSRPRPEYFEDSVSEKTGHVWQPDVYPLAALLARRLYCAQIIDIGCGRAQKLAALHPEFLVTGVDFGENIRFCRQQYNFGQWIEADFEQPFAIQQPAPLLSRSVVVCSDVIEHLMDPTALLQALHALSAEVPLIILSTPERDRARGADDSGPPKNKAHVREWNLPELESLLRATGFCVNFIGLTRSNTKANETNTILAVLTAKPTTGLLERGGRGEALVLEDGRVGFVAPDAPTAFASPELPPQVSSPEPAAVAESPAAVLANIENQIREALAIKPDGVEALRLLAGIRLQSERWVEAANAARRVVELKPDDPDALLILAKCFFKTGDLESTHTVLERVLAIDPGNEMARENLAALETETLSDEERAKKLEQLLLAGREAVAAGNVGEAVKLLEAAAQLDPQDADLCVAIASLQAAQGEVEAARRRLSQALTIDAKHPEAGRMLVELALGAPEAAEEEPSTAQAVETQTRPTVDSTDCKGDSSPIGKNNTTAFVHLQRGFELLKERRFAEAQAESHRYRERVNYDALARTDNRPKAHPKVSVVIVAYKINDGLIQCLDSLAASQNPSHEIIVVDNGGNEAIHAELSRRPILHVRVGFNVILAEGRNIGVHFARSNYAVFIDDDAIAAPGYLAAAVEGFASFDVHAFRGKVLPKSAHPHNSKARHYNLGDLPFPADIDTEGNSAFRIDTWRQLGGQDPLLFGGEGVELSRRIGQLHGDFALMYWPFMVIQHDYAVTDNKLETKSSRHALMREYSAFKHPDLSTFHNRLVAFARNSETKAEGHRLLPRHPAREPSGTTTAVTTQAGDQFFSICVPTYNRAEFIGQTLASAFNQTHQNFEIVVVDDGSTDGTAGIMKRITDPRVRFIIKEHSGGPETRNRCLAEARGEFLVWLDSDDLLLPDTLARYAAALCEHPHVDVLYGNLQVADDRLNIVEHWVYGDYHGWGATLLGDTVVENRIPNVCTLVRKSCYERVGGYNPAFPRAHDYEFWTRLAPVASFRSVNADVGIYRRHEQSLSKVRQHVDTSHEARAVGAMLAAHSLRALFPYCHVIGSPVTHAEARAWFIAALVMLKYGEMATAVEYAKRSAQCADLGVNTRVAGLLEVVSGRTRSTPGAKATDEFGRLAEQAARLFASGQVQPCAQACAKLTELRPDAVETLLLAGLSLRRWANPHDAKTAFRCLTQRQCERAHLEAVTEAEAARRASPPSSNALGNFLAPVFRAGGIPDAALAEALAFIARAAGAGDVRSFMSAHRANQTPLLHAILSLTSEELGQLVDHAVAEQITRVRAALQPPATAAPRRAGYSFCIITGGQRPAKVAHLIATIHALQLPAYEVLVGGEVSKVPGGVRKVDLAEAARSGRLGKMRNELCRRARFNQLVVCDDDLVFAPDFAEGLKRFGVDYDAMAVRIVNPDGSRFWDWATTGGTKGSVLLDYWDTDPHLYITGGICVVKAAVWERVQWDEHRGFYEREDVDFSTRLRAAGFTIRYNVFARVTHDDDRYSRVDRRIYRFDHLMEAILQAHQARELDEVRRLFAHGVRIAANYHDRRQVLVELASRMKIPALLPPDLTPPAQTGATRPPAAPAAQLPGSARLELNWQGSFLDYGSLSNINRVLTDTLVIQNGASIRRLQTAPVNGTLAKPLQAYRGKLAASANAHSALTVRHAWPPDWSRPATGKLAVIQPWEFGSLPKEWVKAAANVDAFWVPSNYVRQVYVDSGVPAEKVHVLPNGIDPKLFRPDAKPLKLATKKSFKFLFVGGTIYRKGPDVLLKAYVESFTAQDDVCLVIKDFGGGSVYAGQTLEQQIRELQKHANAPEILYLNQDLPPHELPGLYTACDCLAHPYRGEGFGLPVLEAMACGLPVIVTAGGATDDFVPDEAGWKIPAQRQVFGREISGLPLVGDGWLLEPDANAVKRLLRRAFANRAEAEAKGRFASEHVRNNWTWKHTAHRLAELARECVAAQSAAGSLPAAAVTTDQRKPAPPLKIALPAAAKLGHLGTARELLKQHKFVPAWTATLEALAIRPFHPEAYLLLAEIATKAGDTKRTQECVDRARALAPNWKTLKQFSKHHSARKSAGKPELPPLPASAEPRLSVCLIAKNEEKFLGQCLRSIRDVANQIVVVDTGSTDRTVAIAQEHGAEVHHFTWSDDFSAARNAALEHATGDWVLVLDADEELSPEGIADLKQAMNTANTISWRLPIVDAGRETEGCTYVPRLFRNAPGLFYISRVHEQVFSSVEVRREEWNLATGVGTAKLIHHGYTTEVIKDRNKIARNLRLLELAIEEIPGDPNLLMNYGLELFRSERPAEGLGRYAEAFAALATKPANEVTPELRETLLTQYSSQLMKLGRWSEIITVLTSPVAQRGGLTASLHFTLGLAHQELRQWTEAITQFRECLRTRGESSFYLVNPLILGGAPRHCLALALWRSGELATAAQEFATAMAEDPTLAPLRMDAARFQSEHGDAVEALKLLHGLVTENSAFVAAWVLGARVALSHPDFIEFARDWTTEAVKHHPNNPDLSAARGETLLLTQQFADALPWWQRLDNAPRSLSARVLCELMQGELSIDGPPAHEVETSREFLNWYRRLIQFRAGAGVQAIGERLELLGIVLPSAGHTLRQVLAEAAVETS